MYNDSNYDQYKDGDPGPSKRRKDKGKGKATAKNLEDIDLNSILLYLLQSADSNVCRHSLTSLVVDDNGNVRVNLHRATVATKLGGVLLLLNWDVEKKYKRILDGEPRYLAYSHIWSSGVFSDGIPICKLRMVFKQMRQLDTPYFWIDTWNVCQDVELIKLQQLPSMPAIYHGADAVIVADRDVYESGQLSDFWSSDWFDRGWTLPEGLRVRSLRLCLRSGCSKALVEGDIPRHRKELFFGGWRSYSLYDDFRMLAGRSFEKDGDMAYVLARLLGDRAKPIEESRAGDNFAIISTVTILGYGLTAPGAAISLGSLTWLVFLVEVLRLSLFWQRPLQPSV